MIIEGPIILVSDESEQLDSSSLRNAELISFVLDIAGKTVDFRIYVTAEQATLADIVPLAREFSTKLTTLFLENLREDGETIPCRKGCSACCNYLVPLSVPEIFRLREELLAMPSDYSVRILRSCLDTAGKILGEKPRGFYLKNSSKSSQPHMGVVSEWYGGLKLACPFLSEDVCILYEQRPLACREHIATGTNLFCQPDHKDESTVAPMPISVVEAVGCLTAELENLDIEAIMLPLAFAWAEDNLWRSKRSWPTETMVRRFVEILKLIASENSAQAALSP